MRLFVSKRQALIVPCLVAILIVGLLQNNVQAYDYDNDATRNQEHHDSTTNVQPARPTIVRTPRQKSRNYFGRKVHKERIRRGLLESNGRPNRRRHFDQDVTGATDEEDQEEEIEIVEDENEPTVVTTSLARDVALPLQQTTNNTTANTNITNNANITMEDRSHTYNVESLIYSKSVDGQGYLCVCPMGTVPVDTIVLDPTIQVGREEPAAGNFEDLSSNIFLNQAFRRRYNNYRGSRSSGSSNNNNNNGHRRGYNSNGNKMSGSHKSNKRQRKRTRRERRRLGVPNFENLVAQFSNVELVGGSNAISQAQEAVEAITSECQCRDPNSPASAMVPGTMTAATPSPAPPGTTTINVEVSPEVTIMADLEVGIYRVTDEGQVIPTNIQGVTNVGNGNARLTIDTQEFFLEDAVVLQGPNGQVFIQGNAQVAVRSGDVVVLEVANGSVQFDATTGGYVFVSNNRRRLQEGQGDNQNDDPQQERHLQAISTAIPGLEFETLITNNPVLQVFGDLGFEIPNQASLAFGRAGLVTLNEMPQVLREYFVAQNVASTERFFFTSFSPMNLASNVARNFNLDEGQGTKLWQFLTKATPDILSVISLAEGILLYGATNVGFPIFLTDFLPPSWAFGGLAITVPKGVCGFSYNDAIQIKRTSSVGVQFGILQEFLIGNILVDGTVGVTVTALDNKVNALIPGIGDTPLNLGLTFEYTGRVVQDWDAGAMAKNPQGVGGFLDFNLFNSVAISGSITVRLGVGPNIGNSDSSRTTTAPGIDNRAIGVAAGFNALLPSIECTFLDSTVQYRVDPTYGRTIAITSDTLLPFGNCAIEPLSSLLKLFDSSANSVGYVHLLEKSTIDRTNPELLIYVEGTTVVFGFQISSVEVEARWLSVIDMTITIAGTLDLRIFSFDFRTQLTTGQNGIMLTNCQMLAFKDPFNILMLSLDAVFTASWDVNSNSMRIMASGEFCLQSSLFGRRLDEFDERNLQLFGLIGNIGPIIEGAINDAINAGGQVVDAVEGALDTVEGAFDTVEMFVADTADSVLTVVETEVVTRIVNFANTVFDIADSVISGSQVLGRPFCFLTSLELKIINGVPCICLQILSTGERCFSL